MPIPAPEIAHIKASVDLVALARSRGIALFPRGKDFVGLCPFHTEKTPSFSISPSVNLFHCLGCGAGGSPIDLVMKLDRVDFRTACSILSGPGSPETAVPGSRMKQKTSPLLEPENQKIMRYALSYYAKTMNTAAAAREYMLSRGLAHPQLTGTFSIGYSDGTLLSALPEYGTPEGRNIRERLLACGVLRKRDGHCVEHMQGRIVVAITDEDGIIHQLYGRTLPGRGNALRHLYLPFSKNCVFHPRAFIAETLIVCEGILDALSFFCAGIPAVSCTYSATDIPPAFLAAVETGNVLRVMIAFDADEAGNRGADRLADLLKDRGIQSVRMQYPRVPEGVP